MAVAGPAMGTRFECVLRGTDEGVLRSAGEQALEEVRRWHGLLSAFDPASVVSRINRAAGSGAWVKCPDEVLELLEFCCAVWERSGGAFDPAVGGLMRGAGFRGDPITHSSATCGNPAHRSETCASPAGGEPVQVDRNNGVCRVVRGEIDLGAVGKGWAIDQAVEVLRGAGVRSALLHGGTSSVAAVGVDALTGEAWRVKVGGEVVRLRDCALGVSEPGGRTVERGGVACGHVLDPRTGESVAGVQRAAVVGGLAAWCDAWSTALLVHGGLGSGDTWPVGYGWRVWREAGCEGLLVTDDLAGEVVKARTPPPAPPFCGEGYGLIGSAPNDGVKLEVESRSVA